MYWRFITTKIIALFTITFTITYISISVSDGIKTIKDQHVNIGNRGALMEMSSACQTRFLHLFDVLIYNEFSNFFLSENNSRKAHMISDYTDCWHNLYNYYTLTYSPCNVTIEITDYWWSNSISKFNDVNYQLPSDYIQKSMYYKHKCIQEQQQNNIYLTHLNDMSTYSKNHESTTIQLLHNIYRMNLISLICIAFYYLVIVFPFLLFDIQIRQQKLNRQETALNEIQLSIDEDTIKTRDLEEYIALIENANAPIFGIDVNGYINEWNEKTKQITGFNKSDVIGTKLIDKIEPDYKDSVSKILNDSLCEINCNDYELQLLTREGHRRFLLVNASTRYNYNRDVCGVIGVAQDITKEKEYQIQQESLQSLLESCLDVVFIRSNKHSLCWDYVSPSFEILFYPTQIIDVLNVDITSFFSRSNEKIHTVHKFVNHTHDTGQIHLKFHNNQIEYHVSYSSIHVDGTNEIFLYFRLLNTEDRLDWIVQNTTDVISLHHKNSFDTEQVNASGMQVIGYTTDELSNINMKTIIHSNHIQRIEEGLENMKVNGSQITVPLQMMTKNNGYQWMEMNMRLVDDKIICVTRNIEERVRCENAERELLMKEEARRREVELVHFLSHQLKNSIIAGIHMLDSIIETLDNQKEYLKDYNCLYKHTSVLMSNLTNAKSIILNEAAIRSILYDEYKLEYKEYLVSQLDEILFRRRIHTTINTEFETILFDHIPIDHIISNLIDNSIKYGTNPINGILSLSTKCNVKNPLFDFTKPNLNTNNIWMNVSITNRYGKHTENLENMSFNQIKSMFNKGVTENNDSMSSGHGTWIILKCLEVVNGKLEFFLLDKIVYANVSIPVKISDDIDYPDLPPNLIIYIIDDSDILRMIYSKIFKRIIPTLRDSNLKIYGSTKDEITNFATIVNNNIPDIVLIDQNLDNPEKGPEYGKKFYLGTDIIKDIKETQQTTITCIRSANNTKQDIEVYLSSGADGIIPKDIMGTELLKNLKRICYKSKGLSWFIDRKKEDFIDTEISDLIPTIVDSIIQSKYELINNNFKWESIHKLKGNVGMLPECEELVNMCELFRHNDSVDTNRLLLCIDKTINTLNR